jgi:hypothetical protein
MNQSNIIEKSNHQKAIEHAYDKGYRSDKNGNIISPFSKKPLKLSSNSKYYRFCIRMNGIRVSISVHKFIGYQKYGQNAFAKNIEIRHLDDISTNNCLSNIGIGTHKQNMMDKSSEKRFKISINAAKNKRKFSDSIVKEIRKKRKSGYSYKQLMKEYNISSKGTMSYIINNKYKTIV